MDEREIVERYEDMQRYIRETSQGKNGSHIAGIAAVALADSLIDEWFFGGNPRESVAEAKRMAASILINQVEANTTDVNENAVQFIVDWVLANRSYFGANAIGTCLGFTSETENTAYIFPSMLNQALTKAGYSPRKTMKYMAERDLIGTDTDRKTGKKQYSIIKWFGTRSARFVEFHIGKLAENKDAIDDARRNQRQRPPGDMAARVLRRLPRDRGHRRRTPVLTRNHTPKNRSKVRSKVRSKAGNPSATRLLWKTLLLLLLKSENIPYYCASFPQRRIS